MKGLSELLMPAALAAVLGLGGGLAPLPAMAEELRLLSSWDSRVAGRRVIAEQFARLLEERSGGEITVAISGPEVVPPFEQIQPVSAGLFDMLFSHGAYHSGSKGLASAVDAITPDPEKRRAAGIFDYVDRFYQENHGLKLIALSSMGVSGYHIITKEPPGSGAEPLAGRKIRGHPGQHGVIRALGASPVGIQGGEIYSALERGVLDGTAWAAIGALDFKWYEVSGHALRPTFGTVTLPIFMNLQRFNALDAETQALLLELGEEIERIAVTVGEEVFVAETEKLQELGMTLAEVSPEAAGSVAQAWAESSWALAKQCCGAAAGELRALAVEAGLSH